MMVDVTTFQTVFQFLQTASIMVGIAYYLMILQNQQKSYDLTYKNRQGQLVLNMMQGITSDMGLTAYGIIRNPSWSSYEDWKRKYGDNEEYMKAFNWVCQGNSGIGVLVRENLADIRLLALYAAAAIIITWEQYQEIIYGFREERGYKYFENWEIAYHILKDYLEEHPEIDPFIK
jgi:hypothetical protein